MRNSSLDRLVLEHLPAAMRFATRLSGDPHQAEEIVQEALLRVVRRWQTFRGEAAFRTWLFRIVINVFRDRLGALPPGVVPLEASGAEQIAAGGAEPAEAAMAAELGETIAREVSRLPGRQREVLILIAYEGLSTREVAAVVGISEANVHSTLSAARARLKVRLAVYLKSIEK